MEKDNLELHTIKDGSFDSHQEGAHIYFKQYFPKKKLLKDAIHIIFQHGAVEYHKRHEEIFDILRERFGNRLVISCMDLVGHGLSGGSRAYVKNFEVYIQDFLRFTRVVQPIYEKHNLDTIVIGHSLGAMILLKTLIDYQSELSFPIKAAIFTNPCIRPKINLPSIVTKNIDHLSNKLGKLRLPSLYDGFDLTSDTARAVAFNNDQLNSNFITVKMGVEILKMSKQLTGLSYFLKVPSYFILSDNDEVVDVATTQLFITGVDKDLVSKSFYPGMKHDILNESCRRAVFQEIIDHIKHWTTYK